VFLKTSFVDLYDLISFFISVGEIISSTNSILHPENRTKFSTGIETVISSNKSSSTTQTQTDAKHTRYVIYRDSNSNGSERGLQIEVPVLRETIDKKPAVRPYFINYSLLGTKGSRKSEYGRYMFFMHCGVYQSMQHITRSNDV
jgi:hypothetical protein